MGTPVADEGPLTGGTAPESLTPEFRYDGNNRVALMTGPDDAETSYDRAGNLTVAGLPTTK
jgi:hypothetical protein